MRRLIAAAALAAAIIPAVALASPANADAAYNMTYGKAGQAARQAAEGRYAPWGVHASTATCRPQQHRSSQRWRPTRRAFARKYHRFVCDWRGTDVDNDEVYGSFIIPGSRSAPFTAEPYAGGLRWVETEDTEESYDYDEDYEDGEYYSDDTCSDDPEVLDLPYCS